MSSDTGKHDKDSQPSQPEKREALKKLGRYAAYTAPATLVMLGYVAATKEGIAVSNLPVPPGPPPP
jgi:hypothetical protein